MDMWLSDMHCMHLSFVMYYKTAIPSAVAKIWSFYEESLSDPNPQTANIKSGIRAENLWLVVSLCYITKDVMSFFISRHMILNASNLNFADNENARVTN